VRRKCSHVGWVGPVLLGVLLTACGGPATTSPSTTLSHTKEVTSEYPPIPLAPPGVSVGCIGRKSTGMTTGKTEQVTRAVTELGGQGGDILSLAACPGGPVLVGLAPGQEPLAHTLWVQYGKDVAITVGLTIYDGQPGRSPQCGVLKAPSPLPTGIHISLHLDSQTVRSGASFSGNVAIQESGPGSFNMDTGQPLQAVVVRPGTHQVIGVFTGAIGGTGYGHLLAPGQSESINVIGGTARCDGQLGSALPPGNYRVIVQVAPEVSPHSPAYLTPPVAVRVIRS
jgi:hypothetical protein